jgi:hypothetical protein
MKKRSPLLAAWAVSGEAGDVFQREVVSAEQDARVANAVESG